jgi:TPR repeat protein
MSQIASFRADAFPSSSDRFPSSAVQFHSNFPSVSELPRGVAMKRVLSSIGTVLLVGIFCLNVALDAYAGTDVEEAKTCPSSDNGIDCLLRLVLNKQPILFRKLAQEGNHNYQYLLGRAYEGGVVGVPQEYGEAVRWYRKSAIQGNGMAQMALGMMYFDGKGVTRSHQAAFTWLKPAAEQGEPLAQVTLGTMYEAGDGVPQNFIQAHMWFSLAAASFSDTRSLNVAGPREVAIMAREMLAERMTQDQLVEAQKLAKEWRSTNVASRLTENWFDEVLR